MGKKLKWITRTIRMTIPNNTECCFHYNTLLQTTISTIKYGSKLLVKVILIIIIASACNINENSTVFKS